MMEPAADAAEFALEGFCMEEKNMAAYLTAVGTIELGPAPLEAPGPGEIQLKVEYVGICGSDVHFYASGQRKGKFFDLPFILGHECAGTVAALGPGVEGLQVGDRVCFEPQITCGTCRYCRSGHYNMCPNVVFPSVPPYHGMLRRYANIPARCAFRLPDSVSTRDGALMEPLAVGLSAASRGDVTLGDRVVILGSGCIGLVTLLACRARGASRILVADLCDNRLEMAKKLGADVVVRSDRENLLERVYAMTDGEGADVVLETAGSPVTAAATADLVRRCGVVVLVGNINGETPYRFMDLMYREGEIRTIYRYKNNFPTALEAVATGAIDPSPLVTHTFDFADTNEAFRLCNEEKEKVVKTVVRIP